MNENVAPMMWNLHRIPYDPDLHGRDRLFRQIERLLNDHRSPLLIGSLGRAAAMRSDQEITLRDEILERDRRGFARDIDLFISGDPSASFAADPFPVDTTAITAHDERIVIENGDYWLVDDLVGCAIEIDADVFQPYTGSLAGELEVRTFSPQTHWALLYVMYDAQERHATARRVICDYLKTSGSTTEAEIYKPFLEFHRIRRASFRNHARRLYRRALPVPVRFGLNPLVLRAKRLASRRSQ